ncbi:ATP-binding cassette domain-containing protein [Lactobacillus pentosus]|uniref:ABC transporter ATP-binding protein n=1 Tax=Lactiplantibacillus pentosus TaxID=1589 RepID=UPI00142520B7|nr:ABC transporter ATP-binding protein [Lactiplantibacillus pentosus]MCH4130501.1 ABC transporter ATP-binding protein/permease [Lactiplantibacillus sp.]BBM22737.1 ABC-type multidrug transport system, ATPase and permease component [Lactiplantibacillus plantarum]MCT3294205.1 ABC transporter ATP-binding protein [Lactiplantibacillus pentosus]MPQ18774.1 ATP-binding cassette domain-containing protein [Lactiplantibacillus pentosus]UXI96548.1 ABC transporter ATP-binding protein/permease [Lactiplantiba
MFHIVMQHIHGRARWAFFLAPLIMLGEVFCDLQQPTLMSEIIDQGLSKGDLNFVISHAGLMLLFAVLGLIFGGACGALGSYASLKMGEALRSHLLTVALNDRQAGSLPPATLITRITNDVTQMQNLVMMVTRGLVRSPMLLIGGVVMSIIVCPDLAPILFVVMPILVVFLLIIVRLSVPKYTAMQQSVDHINQIMRENLQGAKTIKSYVLEDHQHADFTTSNQHLQQTSQTAAMATVLLSPVIQLMLNLGVVVALGYGGQLAISDTISNGQIIAFVNYMIQITSAMIQTVNIITAFSRAITSATRVQAVLDMAAFQVAPAQVAAVADLKPHGSQIEFDQVSFGYQQSRPILDHVSFTVPDGQWLGIIGATGAGKSTLINLLTRRFYDYHGTIKIGGVDIQQMPLSTVHAAVAVALQDSLLFSGTVRSNLTYGRPDATDAELTNATAIADAQPFIAQLPAKYDAPVEQAGKNFSGGQRQRLNLARAIVPATDILVLDDATSAVDQTTNAAIKSRLREQRADKTTLIISQRVTNVIDCDQILVLNNGRSEAIGTHAELMQQSPFYRQLVTTQLGGAPDANA